MCFGGVDATWNNLPKFYNAYMLFYQRTSSIQQTEKHYNHTDQLNPIRLEIPPNVQYHISKQNELFLRSYCAQDPAHARFVRQLLERLWETSQGECSENHDVEERTLRLALDYMHNISSRWKSQPEMEATAKLINKYSRRCSTCASSILQWFTGDRILLEGIVKSPYQATRKTFSNMLRTCLVAVHTSLSEEPRPEVTQMYQSSLASVVERLGRAWDLVARTSRAWTEYFHLLAEIVDLGVNEARLVIDSGFFDTCFDLISVHYFDLHELRVDRKLRAQYASYLNAKERNRPFNHTALINLFARMLFRLDLSSWSNGDQRVVQEGGEGIGLTSTEIEMLGLHTMPYDLKWLKRIIAGRTSALAADHIVAFLASERHLAGAVSEMIVWGLEHKSMPVAAAFLQPLLVFCSHCGNMNQIIDLLIRFAESVPTIGLDYGKEYSATINTLLRIENQALGREAGFLRDVLAEQIHHWAPVLLVAGSDMAVDVRGDALEMVSVLLLDRLDATQNEDPSQYRVYQARALLLAKQAADYVQSAFLNPNASENQNLQPGHAHQIMQAVDRCLASAEVDNAEDEQRVEEIQRVMLELKGRADQAVETLSTAEWQESSEMDALSEDFDDLVSP